MSRSKAKVTGDKNGFFRPFRRPAGGLCLIKYLLLIVLLLFLLCDLSTESLMSTIHCEKILLNGCCCGAQQGGASAAGAWSRGRPSTAGAGGDVRLDPRVEASVDAYRTLNQLLMDYIEHVGPSLTLQLGAERIQPCTR